MSHHRTPSGDGVRSRGGAAALSRGGRFGHAPPARRREGDSPMASITLQRLVRELDKLKPQANAGRLKSHAYARRLARMIQQLRERGLDADRAAATAALAEALERGALTAPMEAHLHNRLGLA